MSSKINQKPITSNVILKDADYEKSSPIEKTHQRGKQLDDPRFGQVTLYSNPANRSFVAVKERKVTDKAEAGRLITAARQRLAMTHPNLINLLDYSVTKQSELCSSFYIIRYFFEFPKNDLRKQFIDRQKQGVGFNSQELTNLLYQQVQAQSYLQNQGLAHGDIQPVLIGYDPEKKESKLIDKSDLAPNEQAVIAIQKNHLVSQSSGSIYQSPTMYQNLKKGNQKFTFDKNKEDAYALGLVLLEAGNGRKIENIYDNKSGTVDQNALNQHLNEFRGKFESGNQLLTSTVANLVNPNEAQRPSPVQVQSSLPPYEEVQRFFTQNQNATLQGGSTNTYTRTEIDGGNQNIVIRDKVVMPEVDIDLFSFNPQTNPYKVNSPVYEEEVHAEPEQFVVAQPKYVFKHQEPQYTPPPAQAKETQVVYNEPVVENYHDYNSGFAKNRVYSEAPVSYVQESYAPTTVHRVYTEQAPVQTVRRSFVSSQPQVTYSQPQVTSYHDQSYSTASYTNPNLTHEFRLHDSSIVKPEVITNDSYTTHAYQPHTSQVVYTSTPTYQSQRNNVVYSEAPVTRVQTVNDPIVRRSYTSAPIDTIYSQPNRVSYTTSRVIPAETVYTQPNRVSYTTSSIAPAQTTVYTEGPRNSYRTYSQINAPITSIAPAQTTVYTEGPRNSYRTYSQVNAPVTYTEAPRSNVVYSTAPTTEYITTPTANTYVHANTYSSGIDTTGLKLVKTYTDSRLATENRNY